MGFTGVISPLFCGGISAIHQPQPQPQPGWISPKRDNATSTRGKRGENDAVFYVFCNNHQRSKKLFDLICFWFIQVFTYKYFTWGKWCLVKDRYLMSRLAWTRLLQYFFECSLCSFCFKTQVFSKESHCRLQFHFT